MGIIRRAASSFWAWYERHYTLNVSLAVGFFALQLIHLYWLTGHVVAQRLFGYPFFSPGGIWQHVIVLIDYTEIPALISVSLIYIHDLSRGRNWKSMLYLGLLNIQWLHIFWITDEFVIDQFLGRAASTVLPVWLAWVAIGIDYLELPVIANTFARALRSVRAGKRWE